MGITNKKRYNVEEDEQEKSIFNLIEEKKDKKKNEEIIYPEEIKSEYENQENEEKYEETI